MDDFVRTYLMKDYLSHHGIKGQKWSERNGPPYPLSNSAHSSSEKKAGWQESIADSQKVAGLEDIDPAFLTTAVALVAPALITKGSRIVSNILKRKREKQFTKNVQSESDLPKKQSPGTIESEMAAVNPNFKGYQRNNGYIENCMYCSTVYDLRRRGYDVTANERKSGGPIKEVTEWYKGAKLEPYTDKAKAYEALQKQPEGARGNVMGMGPFGGHSIAYEIKDGNVELIDAQINRSWSWDEFTKGFGRYIYIARTDNCEPNWERIGQTIDPNSLKRRK